MYDIIFYRVSNYIVPIIPGGEVGADRNVIYLFFTILTMLWENITLSSRSIR